DGEMVLTRSGDMARLWRTDTGQPLGQPMKHGSDIQAVAFSGDGQVVLTGGGDTARLWRADTGQLLGQPMIYGARIHAVVFSPDGRKVLVATRWWLHIAQFDGAGTRALVSRLLPEEWPVHGDFHFLDASANRVQVAVSPTADSIRIITLQLDSPDATPVQGDPQQLLIEWQRKLGLEINKAGEIVPNYE